MFFFWQHPPVKAIFKTTPPEDFTLEFGNPKEIVSYFGEAKIFTQQEARDEADRMYEEIMASNMPILEYGISYLKFSKPFSWYEEEAKRQPQYIWDKEEAVV